MRMKRSEKKKLEKSPTHHDRDALRERPLLHLGKLGRDGRKLAHVLLLFLVCCCFDWRERECFLFPRKRE